MLESIYDEIERHEHYLRGKVEGILVSMESFELLKSKRALEVKHFQYPKKDQYFMLFSSRRIRVYRTDDLCNIEGFKIF